MLTTNTTTYQDNRAEAKPSGEPRPVAAIDLGSNTVRLLIATAKDHRPRPLLVRTETTRLGQGLSPGGKLHPEAVARTWQVLTSYHREITDRGTRLTLVGATMAARQATDGSAFLERISTEFGFVTRLLSGRQESEVTTAGVMTVLDPVPDQVLIFDLGGRSTEFILMQHGSLVQTSSLTLGCVSLTEAYIQHDPPTPEEIGTLRAEISTILQQGLQDLQNYRRSVTLVGTAGTTTTLAAMAQGLKVYQPDLINNYRLNRTNLDRLFSQLTAHPVNERRLLTGLPPDRADVIIAGAAVVLEVMDFINKDYLTVSDAGLLEGLWLTADDLRSMQND